MHLEPAAVCQAQRVSLILDLQCPGAAQHCGLRPQRGLAPEGLGPRSDLLRGLVCRHGLRAPVHCPCHHHANLLAPPATRRAEPSRNLRARPSVQPPMTIAMGVDTDSCGMPAQASRVDRAKSMTMSLLTGQGRARRQCRRPGSACGERCRQKRMHRRLAMERRTWLR